MILEIAERFSSIIKSEKYCFPSNEDFILFQLGTESQGDSDEREIRALSSAHRFCVW